MATWTKKTFSSTGVTEYPAGPGLGALQSQFGGKVVLALDVFALGILAGAWAAAGAGAGAA